jgi:hypothetical protein
VAQRHPRLYTEDLCIPGLASDLSKLAECNIEVTNSMEQSPLESDNRLSVQDILHPLWNIEGPLGVQPLNPVSHLNPVHTFIKSSFFKICDISLIWELSILVTSCTIGFPFAEGVGVFPNHCVHTGCGAQPDS